MFSFKAISCHYVLPSTIISFLLSPLIADGMISAVPAIRSAEISLFWFFFQSHHHLHQLAPTDKSLWPQLPHPLPFLYLPKNLGKLNPSLPNQHQHHLSPNPIHRLLDILLFQ
jgi:hypothetical protein